MTSEQKTLLFIDDEAEFLNICKHFFEMKKFKVLTSISGLEGLKIIKSEKPDLVILDLKMPEFDGMRTLKSIRLFDKKVKVIIVTGYGTDADIRESSELGVSDFIHKPFDLNTLLKIIQKPLAAK